MNERHVVSLDLSVALIAAQLTCSFNDTKDSAAGACLGVAEETAVRVDRQVAFDGGQCGYCERAKTVV